MINDGLLGLEVGGLLIVGNQVCFLPGGIRFAHRLGDRSDAVAKFR